MPSMKSSTIRIPRSKLQARNPRIPTVHRSLTATAKNATSIERRQQPTHTSPLILPQASHTQSRPPNAPPTSPSHSDFDTLLNALTGHLTTTPKPHLPTLQSLLRSYTSPSSSSSNASRHPPSWSQYAHANPSKQYTRNLITSVPGIFNLLLLVWTPGMRSPIHDHADSHCLMKVLRGTLRERRFEFPVGEGGGGVVGGREEGLKEIARLDFAENKVAYISDKIGLHEIMNPSEREYAVSLHLYTPPNAATYGCHVYDPITGESKHVMQCAYDSVRGVVGGVE
ncbi:Cysteine dioxygenase [Cadophora gregata f. sp. sojae]|nr:Cysteine dioxygenase [Cadophora gregata f. sp. sojae]